jgi:hypothetical protein
MGTDVRTFFCPVAAEEAPQDRNAAYGIVGDRYGRKEETGLRTSVSRNGWHLASLTDAAGRNGSSALDFLKEDFALLDIRQAAAALGALASILADAAEGLEALATTASEAASEALLAISLDQDPEQLETRRLMQAAYREAMPSYDVEWTGDAGYGALDGYFAFLKSLAACLLECLQKGHRLLFCKIG